MSLPFFGANVVEVFKDNLPDVAASEAAYWTRLAVPDGLPVFAEDRAWAEAILAHYNPVTQRCFVVALGREDMIAPFLGLYPDGIGSGGPNDQPWAREINPHKELDLSVVEGAELLVLNELPEQVPPPNPPGSLGSGLEGAPDPTSDGGSSDDEELPSASSEGSAETGETEPGEYQGPDLGQSATEPSSGGEESSSETEPIESTPSGPSDESGTTPQEASEDAAGPTTIEVEAP